ncbi:DUF3014 domain-containing protein [Acanthopleuribacter pedis]|uniref:DUF3014 domain-containing protein n=1 Tax=Acanthopleuribacter pedis TaxID=442870 RepID=A0A8J7U530_9BACT|nr:DUF3014 domain-containing protein [Acanthopleuribacter pedis]MBO1320068.1 DUF3014 domain-containing protein [Acanthopleuribacter pedis]
MSKNAVKIGIGLLAVISIGLVALLFLPEKEDGVEPGAVATEQTATETAPPTTNTPESGTVETTGFAGEETAQTEPLVPGPVPDLEKSDDYLRERWSETNAVVGSMLEKDDLIRKVTTAVELMSMDQNPGKMLHFLRPDEVFKTEKDASGRVMMSGDNYDRYDRLVTAFESLDSNLVAAYYLKMGPVFESAYDELGNGDDAREQKFEALYQRIMNLQVPEGPVELVGGPKIYIYADADLEAKTALEKAFIRMGPQNTRRIQAKFQAIYEAYQQQR